MIDIRRFRLRLLALLLAPVMAQAAPTYSLTKLGSLDGTSRSQNGGLTVQSTATGINNAGQIVGYSWVAGDSLPHGFIYQNGVMTDLGNTVIPRGINDSGQVISVTGLYQYQNGNLNYVSDLGGIYGFDINNSGQVAGLVFEGGSPRPALYANGALTQLWPGYEGEALGINDGGQVVGNSVGLGQFIYTNGSANVLSLNFIADDMNNSGDIVGGGPGAMPQLRKDGIDYFLDQLVANMNGWVLFNASDINNSGQIIALACHVDHPCQAALLTPGTGSTDLPEPGSTGIMLTGLALLGCLRARRNGAA